MASTAQRLRLLDGRYVLERRALHEPLPDEWLSLVRVPDGVTVVRRAIDGAAGGWAALYGGDTAHAPEAPGMLVALLAPLAAAGIPVMVASTRDADVVLVPQERLAAAAEALRDAGHDVAV